MGSSIAAMGVAVFLRWPAVVKEGRAVKVWLSMVGLLLFALFQVDGLCLAVGGPARWPAYLFLILAIYFFSVNFASERPRWTSFHLAATLVVLVSLAVFLPKDLPLVGLSYGYAVVTLSTVPIRRCIHALRDGGARLPPYVRLRTALILPTLGIAVLSFTIELLVRASNVFSPASSSFVVLYIAGKALQAIAICLWSLCFLADRVYDDLLIRPARFARKLSTLRKLRRLQARLDDSLRLVLPSTMASATDKTTWGERLRDPDYHIYRTVISILDDKKVLDGYLKDDASWPGDACSLRKAQRLGRVLREHTREDASFEHLVEAYHLNKLGQVCW